MTNIALMNIIYCLEKSGEYYF